MKTIYTLIPLFLLFSFQRTSGQCDTISVFPFTETFEENSPSLACWTQQNVIGNEVWTFDEGSGNGAPSNAFEGLCNARYTDNGSGAVTKLISPVLDLGIYTEPCILTFYYAQSNWSGDINTLKVYYRTGPASPWIEIFSDNTNKADWTYQNLELPSPSSAYQIAFEGTDNYGHPNVIDLVTVHPPCNPITQFPFTESFELTSPTRQCWTQELITGNKFWVFRNGALGGSPYSAHSGETNFCFTNSGNTTFITRIISPVFDLTVNSTLYFLSFYYAQEEDHGDQNYLNVYYRIDPAASWILLFSDSVNRPDWTLANFGLPNASATYQLAFEGIANGGIANVIDKVMISSCSIPQNLAITDISTNSATVSWVSGGLDNQWDLKTGDAGFNPDTSGTLFPALSANSLALSGLDEGTFYDVWIRPVCIAGDTNPWIGPYRFYTRYSIPYYEGFDSVSFNATAPGWSSISKTMNPYYTPYVAHTPPGHSEPYSVILDNCFNYKKSVSTDEPPNEFLLLLSPEMIVPLNQLRLSFYAADLGGSSGCGTSGLAVGTLTDPADYNTFTQYQVFTLTSGWQYFFINLNNYSGDNKYIGFKLIIPEFGSGRAIIDDVLFSELPSCLEPTDFLPGTITQHEITINWSPGQNETSWDVIYGITGFNPATSGTIISDIPDNTLTVTGLSASTTYDFYVRADCGNGDLSNWTGPLTVNTLCGAVSEPVYQYFDNTSPGNIPICWTAINTPFSMSMVQTDVNTSAPNCLAMFNDLSAVDTIYFVTPQIINQLNTLMISFNAYSYETANMLTLGTMSDTSDPSTFIPVHDFVQTTMYSEWEWDFSQYTGNNQYIAFRLAEDATVLIDDIKIYMPFYCNMPDSLLVEQITGTTATISWYAVNQESNWEISIGFPGFDPLSQGNLLSAITQNPYTIIDLDQGTNYELYVRALCDNGDYSDFNGPLALTTSCEPQPLPWLEDFESVPLEYLPLCWYSFDENNDGSEWITGDDGSGNHSLILTQASEQPSHDDWFFTPPFYLLAGHSYTISFDYMGYPFNNNNYVEVFNGSSAYPASMNPDSLYHVQISNTNYETGSFEFTPAADGINIFGWHCTSPSPQSNIYIDYVSIIETIPVTCPPDFYICAGGSTLILNEATPSGGVYSGNAVYQNPDMEYVFDPNVAGVGAHTITYTFTNLYVQYQCQFNIIVNTLPSVGCPPDVVFCYGNPPMTLYGGTPAGGTYSGPGVSDNLFDANIAGIGNHLITYNYTDVNLCSVTCTFYINVYAGEVLSVNILADTLAICDGDTVTITAFPNNAGPNPYLQWYVNNILSPDTGIVLQISPAVQTSVYCFVSSFVPCTMSNPATSNTLSVNVIPILNPALIISANEDTVCEGTQVLYQVATATDTGISPVFQWQINGINVGSNSLSYAYSPVNSDTIKCLLTVNDPCVAQNQVTSNVLSPVVIPSPLVALVLPIDTVCINWDTITLTGGFPFGGIFSGAGVVNQQFNPILAGQGSHLITYTFVDTSGCESSNSAVIYVDYCTGLAGIIETEKLTIYPNPAKDKLMVRFNKGILSPDFAISDLLGQKHEVDISFINQNLAELNISSLKPGIYTLLFNQLYSKFLVIR